MGAALGASAEAGIALLLYTEQGFLGTAGFLVALVLSALAVGLWIGRDAGSSARRLLGAVVALVAAAIFAVLWSSEPSLRGTGFGGALAVLFLLAEPAYTAGAVFAALQREQRQQGPPALLGAAFGILAASLFLIPRLPASVIFLTAAAVLALIALLQRRTFSLTVPNEMDFALNDRIAIVTGVGDRGQVGYAIAQQLLAAGARVCIIDVTERVTALGAELGREVMAVRADLSNEEDVARCISGVRERFGKLDILVNAAGGLSVIKPLAETSLAEWQREWQRNAQTTFLMTRAALPLLRQSRGAVVSFASPAGVRGAGQLGAYSAAKAGVVAFTRALAIEEKTQGVRINALAPGMIDTEQNRGSVGDTSRVKWVTREQIANAVLFLASDAASGITGETIHVLAEGIE